MDQGSIITIIQDAIVTMTVISIPLLGLGLLVGIILSIFQATTQINEQTIIFVSKILAVFVALIIFGPWMLVELQSFTLRIFEYMQTMVR